LTKAVEKRALAAADGVVTLTDRIWPIIREWDGLSGRKVAHTVVPCCTDLQLFSFNPDDRIRIRTELGIGHQLTLVYSGSVDGWYLTERMADFFAFILRRRPQAHFIWLTNARERVNRLMQDRGIPGSNFTIKFVSAAEVPRYLAAADVGLAFILPSFSKLASSPTKLAEYLGCGLPLVINAGIGDADALVTEEGAGALVRGFDDAEYGRALTLIEGLIEQAEATRARSRNTAERLFDLRVLGAQRYADLYDRVFNS
jgi:glycosyltransferase involved in cell wall biosynthesis